MGRPRTFDEPSVMRRAGEAFHDHGYTATSVEQLTEATGLNRSSLYGAFGDKHALFLRAFAEYCEEDATTIEAELSGDDAGTFARLERHLISKTADPAASRRGCLLAKATAELASEDPDVARIAADFYAGYEQALAECLRQAQAAGDIRVDIEPVDGGAMLLAVLRGIEALGRAGYPERALQRIADTTLASLAPPPSTSKEH